MAVMTMGPELQLPWAVTAGDDGRFRKYLWRGLAVLLVIGIVVPLLPVKEIPREEKEALPPQLARVIMEKKELPKPEPIVPKPVEPKPKPKPEPVKKEPPKEKPKPKPVDVVQQAKATAAVSGLLAFQDDLTELRESVDVNQLNKQQLSRGEASAAETKRSIITQKSAQSSGGVQVSAVSEDTGGRALSGRKTTKVGTPDGFADKPQAIAKATAQTISGRSDQDIRRIMDKNKGAIFSIYNRALRKDPALQGRFVFEMVINPAGAVTKVKLISSELADKALAQKILARIQLINFGAANVTDTVVNYSFDFLPY